MSEYNPSATEAPPKTNRLSRSRGATSGILLVLLGAWGALIPFIGPSFDFAFSPDKTWHWTAARGWYEVLPGSVAFVGGLLLLFGTSRAMTSLGAWLGILAGAWFIVGPPLTTELTLGNLGQPTGSSSGLRALETLAYFYGLGAIILFLAAAAFGRLSVVTVRDMRTAERRQAALAEADERAAQQQARDRETTHRELFGPRGENGEAADGTATDPRTRDGIAGSPSRRSGVYDQHADDRDGLGSDTNTTTTDRAATDRAATDRTAAERGTSDPDRTQEHHTPTQQLPPQAGGPAQPVQPEPGSGFDQPGEQPTQQPTQQPSGLRQRLGRTPTGDTQGSGFGRHGTSETESPSTSTGAPPPPPPRS